ncbi:hypothetical protein L227DRAFT_581842 [Lentinus tigrinus ALCF2SS1-6]|uniref:Uncharacterized protein n=2 Tax=Lentinus tigrinus TaxID=5365 RepID=A0A5C2RQV4_9APHY|nr:hypothetical protein L227DRAFT_581842 [Lentinus tigrinus ALCF2SS1-6]
MSLLYGLQFNLLGSFFGLEFLVLPKPIRLSSPVAPCITSDSLSLPRCLLGLPNPPSRCKTSMLPSENDVATTRTVFKRRRNLVLGGAFLRVRPTTVPSAEERGDFLVLLPPSLCSSQLSLTSDQQVATPSGLAAAIARGTRSGRLLRRRMQTLHVSSRRCCCSA